MTTTIRTSRRRGSAVADGHRASARRRRSRSLYCVTNGCASFLVPDDSGSVARCPVCGYERRLA